MEMRSVEMRSVEIRWWDEYMEMRLSWDEWRLDDGVSEWDEWSGDGMEII